MFEQLKFTWGDKPLQYTRKHLNEKKVARALTQCSGLIHKAAKFLNVDFTILHNYIEKSTTLKKHIEVLRQKTCHEVEEVLINKCLQGNLAAIKYYLYTQDKNLNYGQNGIEQSDTVIKVKIVE